MRTAKRTLPILAAVLLMVGVMSALAQEPRPQEPSIAQGQLLKVDATARTIAIRSATGTQMQFSYTEDTKVVGADQGVAGLATITPAAAARRTSPNVLLEKSNRACTQGMWPTQVPIAAPLTKRNA